MFMACLWLEHNHSDVHREELAIIFCRVGDRKDGQTEMGILQIGLRLLSGGTGGA
jgi:hypothetical protein